MNRQQVLIQGQKKQVPNTLAETIRSFEGKYERIQGMLSGGRDTNMRCVIGALLSECGWNGDFLGLDGLKRRMEADRNLRERFPELIAGFYPSPVGYQIPNFGNWSLLVEKNNNGASWEELAQFVERGFKD